MRCEGQSSIRGRQCNRIACVGIFCSYHANYIEETKKKIIELQLETERVEKLQRVESL